MSIDNRMVPIESLDAMRQLLAMAQEERDKLAAALENILDEKHRPPCNMGQHNVAPGGHDCDCPQWWASAALKRVEEKP